MSGHAAEALNATAGLKEEVRKVLPNLPDKLLLDFVNELEKAQIFCLEKDLPDTDEKDLDNITVLKGPQRRKFLDYARGLRIPKQMATAGNNHPSESISATGILGEGTVTMKDNASVSAEAKGSGQDSSGSAVVKGVVAKTVTMEKDTKVTAVAGNNDGSDEEERSEPPHGMYT